MTEHQELQAEIYSVEDETAKYDAMLGEFSASLRAVQQDLGAVVAEHRPQLKAIEKAQAGAQDPGQVVPGKLASASEAAHDAAEAVRAKNGKVVRRITAKEVREELREDGGRGRKTVGVLDEVRQATQRAGDYAREATEAAQAAYKFLAQGKREVWRTAQVGHFAIKSAS